LKKEIKDIETQKEKQENFKAELEYNLRASEYNVEILKNQIELCCANKNTDLLETINGFSDIIGDLNSRRCVIQEMGNRGHLKNIKGLVPLAEMFGYATATRSLSQGRATYTMEPHSYQEVPKAIADKITVK